MRRRSYASAKSTGQQCIAAGSDFKEIKKFLEVSGQFKETQRVAKRRGIDNDVVVAAAFQQLLDGQQPRDLSHSRQRSIKQRSDLFLAEEGAVLDDAEDPLSVLGKKFFEFAPAIDLPERELALDFFEPVRAGSGFDLQHVRQRMRRVGGHQQR